MHIRTLAMTAAIAGGFLFLGCDKAAQPKPTKPKASASAKSTAQAKAKPKLRPAALNVAQLKAQLKCSGGGHGPCAVLDEMKTCEPLALRSADMRWLGKGEVVDKGAFVSEIAMLRMKRVGTATVSPGQLAMKVAIEKLDDDRGTEKTHALKAIRELRRGDVTKATNQAVRYIKNKSEWQESFAMQAEANQAYVTVAGGAYLCLKKDRRMIVVKHAGSQTHPADGLYAVMWPISW